MVTKVNVEVDSGRLSGNLNLVIEYLNEVLTSVPEAYRDDAYIEVEADEYYGSISIDVSAGYFRPETEDEVENRLLDAERYSDRQRYHELKTLAFLQAKYGTGVKT